MATSQHSALRSSRSVLPWSRVCKFYLLYSKCQVYVYILLNKSVWCFRIGKVRPNRTVTTWKNGANFVPHRVLEV